MKKDTVIIIPAFNEDQSIGLVLHHIPRSRIQEIIVVDNGSTDKTSKIAKDHGALVVRENQKGYGMACLKGIEAAKKYNPRNVVFIDADYSDNPKEMPLLLAELDKGADLVIGSRTLGKAEKGALLPQAIFGNWLATNLLYLFYRGKKFSDLGPFRAIRWDKLLQINMEDEDFGWTVEMQLKALIHNLDCREISVSYKKRIGVSKITGTMKGTFLAGYKILFIIFKFKILRRPWPLLKKS
ncbi:MAG: glycosyltransferase family 2 protein [Epsilonproteobacteria bacterium]|nr:MAG: glycosyltransferase family 2 protein [Campylobacterota bacterium]